MNWDVLYDFTLLIGLFACILVLALGNVKPETSYGLREIIAILGVLAGARAMRWKNGTEPK